MFWLAKVKIAQKLASIMYVLLSWFSSEHTPSLSHHPSVITHFLNNCFVEAARRKSARRNSDGTPKKSNVLTRLRWMRDDDNSSSTKGIMTMAFIWPWNARMGVKGLRYVGYLRIAYALIILYDQVLLGLDLNTFFSPKSGLAPVPPLLFGEEDDYDEDEYDEDEDDWYVVGELGYEYSLLHLFVQSELWMWIVWGMGIFSTILLGLGMAPRLNVALVFMVLHSFRRTTFALWNGGDRMVTLFGFHLLFLPLHHITVHDGFGRPLASKSGDRTNAEKTKEDRKDESDNKPKSESHLGEQQLPQDSSDSWPMWPVWLLQWEMCLVYLGAFCGKIDGISTSQWVQGTAMYYVVHFRAFYGGLLNPDFIFNRMLPLKLLTWVTIFIEGLVPIVIWFPGRLRQFAFTAALALHLGIELSMNLHTFQWITMWGFCFCHLDVDKKVSLRQQDSDQTGKSWSMLPQVLSRGIGFSLFCFLWISMTSLAFPWDFLQEPYIFPQSVVTALQPIAAANEYLLENYPIQDLSRTFGYKQKAWYLFETGITGELGCDYVMHVTLRNGTRVQHVWETPTFMDMPLWEQKRRIREKTFTCHMQYCDGGDGCRILVSWVQHMFANATETHHNNNGTMDLGRHQNVVKYEFWQVVRKAPSLGGKIMGSRVKKRAEFNEEEEEEEEGEDSSNKEEALQWWQAPKHSGWWGPVRRPEMEVREHKFVWSVLVCQDVDVARCYSWAKDGLCRHGPPHGTNNTASLVEQQRNMSQNCPRTCGYCNQDVSQWTQDEPDNWYDVYHLLHSVDMTFVPLVGQSGQAQQQNNINSTEIHHTNTTNNTEKSDIGNKTMLEGLPVFPQGSSDKVDCEESSQLEI